MMEGKVKSIRLPEHVIERADARARRLGLSFNDVVEHALRQELKMDSNPAIALLMRVADWLSENFSQQKFPQNITLMVFREIRDQQEFRALYDAAIVRDGCVDTSSREAVHRRVGLLVKRVLDAEVIGRSLELDRDVELIRTHSLLAPKSSSGG